MGFLICLCETNKDGIRVVRFERRIAASHKNVPGNCKSRASGCANPRAFSNSSGSFALGPMDRLLRIHIFGASGSGTTSLGAALADRLGVMHLDVDDFYWQKTDPPFRIKNEPEERVRAIREKIGDRGEWVLTGSIVSWGEPFLNQFTLAIFLELDPKERMHRLREREAERYGDRIGPKGDLRSKHLEFLEWAQAYDTAEQGVRCRPVHLRWMANLDCDVLRLNSIRPIEDLVAEVLRSAALAADFR